MQSFDEWLIARLRAHGAYGGRLDGAHGREVIAALVRFQTAEGIVPSGLADALTIERLRLSPKRPATTEPAAPPPDAGGAPVWMREARRFMGLREIAGPKSNPVILGWAKALGGWIATYYADDETPWCGLFVANLIATTLPTEALPANPLSALAWSGFGSPLLKPAVGAILTFTRKGGGHVGFYVGEDTTHFHILGGNQSNSVSIARIEQRRLDAIRWPKSGEAPVGGRVRLSAAGLPLSQNEA